MTARPHRTTPVERARDALLERARRAMVGQFEILGTVRHESLVAAYTARDTRSGEDVTLRVFHPELFPTDVAAKRFARQMSGAMNLRRPNVVTMRAVEIVDSLVFLVADAVKGASLEQVLTFEPMLAAPVARSVLVQVAAALEEAHSAGVLHGDVRPSAITITATGEVLLADLGLVQALAAAGAAVEVLPSLSSRYQSPDTIRTGFTSEAADQYSLGVVAYEMLMGKPPFVGSAAEVRAAHLGTRPPAIQNDEADIPDDLAGVVMRMLNKAPRERFAALADVVQALSSEFGEFDDRSKGPLSWLAQQSRVATSGDAGTAPPARRRTIVQTPLPFVDTLPPLRQPEVRGVRTTAAAQEELQIASIDDFAPLAAQLEAAVPATPAGHVARATPAATVVPAMPGPPGLADAHRTLGRAIEPVRSRSRTLMGAATVAGVLVAGAMFWRQLSTSRAATAATLGQMREQVTFPEPEVKAPTGSRAAPEVTPPARPPAAKGPALAKATPNTTPNTTPNATPNTTRGSAPGTTPRPTTVITPRTVPPNTGKVATVPQSTSSAAPDVPASRAPAPSVVQVASAPPPSSAGAAQVVPPPPSAPTTQVVLPQVSQPAASTSAQPLASESPRVAPRLSDADAANAAHGAVERLRNADVDGFALGLSGSRSDRDFLSWLRRRPTDLRVSDARAGSIAMQPDGTARVSYAVPISWTHASGAKPQRTASIVVTVDEKGKVAGWTLAAPFVP